jgi:hypothetical protein
VYNRTASKAQTLTSNPDLSIQQAATPQELAAACSIICLMLAGAAVCMFHTIATMCAYLPTACLHLAMGPTLHAASR